MMQMAYRDQCATPTSGVYTRGQKKSAVGVILDRAQKNIDAVLGDKQMPERFKALVKGAAGGDEAKLEELIGFAVKTNRKGVSTRVGFLDGTGPPDWFYTLHAYLWEKRLVTTSASELWKVFFDFDAVFTFGVGVSITILQKLEEQISYVRSFNRWDPAYNNTPGVPVDALATYMQAASFVVYAGAMAQIARNYANRTRHI